MDKAWKKFWDDLYKNMPDHTSAPTEGPFYRGDICKGDYILELSRY